MVQWGGKGALPSRPCFWNCTLFFETLHRAQYPLNLWCNAFLLSRCSCKSCWSKSCFCFCSVERSLGEKRTCIWFGKFTSVARAWSLVISNGRPGLTRPVKGKISSRQRVQTPALFCWCLFVAGSEKISRPVNERNFRLGSLQTSLSHVHFSASIWVLSSPITQQS